MIDAQIIIDILITPDITGPNSKSILSLTANFGHSDT